jgi:mRNA interferase RelE/StbE
VARVIDEVEAASSVREIRNIKKLKGHRAAYRVRVGDYRIGLFVSEGSALFAAVLPRKDIYRKFP